ncbi:MAG: class I SAM-dependent methyltransferase, partial [Planctomycetes bacterium]|nr:class I SAM-dependent methyltransferase [Planctomycetota bacterium]
RLFVEDLLKEYDSRHKSSVPSLRVFDAGTGTALIPIELVRRRTGLHISASDLSNEMLKVAATNIASSGFDSQIRLVFSDCKHLSDEDATYDIVMSNSIIHHIPEPKVVLNELWRILKPNGLLFVRDLLRPIDLKRLNWLVETYAADANEHQRKMFADSLHAALTLEELRNLLKEIGVPEDAAQATSDRHWTIATFKSA